MIEFLRRHAVVLAIAMLVWTGWSASASPVEDDYEEDEMEQGSSLPILPLQPEVLAPVAAVEPGQDPFRLAALLRERQERQGDLEAGAEGSAAARGERDQRRLVLQATWPNFPTPAATLNGHDVVLGAPVPGVDPAAPPVLVAVQGTRATVRWRDQELELDLDRSPSVPLEVEDATETPDSDQA